MLLVASRFKSRRRGVDAGATAERSGTGRQGKSALRHQLLALSRHQHGHARHGAFDLREFPHDDKARFVNSVTHGKNNRMPPWGDILKPEDIDNLWAYVLTGGKP